MTVDWSLAVGLIDTTESLHMAVDWSLTTEFILTELGHRTRRLITGNHHRI